MSLKGIDFYIHAKYWDIPENLSADAKQCYECEIFYPEYELYRTQYGSGQIVNLCNECHEDYYDITGVPKYERDL